MVNIEAADALDLSVPRSSAAIILIQWDKHTLIFHQEVFQIPASSQCWKWVQISFMFIFYLFIWAHKMLSYAGRDVCTSVLLWPTVLNYA